MVGISEQTATDYTQYVQTDLKTKLDPINSSVDAMLSRMEEFQTMIAFAKQERTQATQLLASLLDNEPELRDLFARIDAIEKVVEHAKSNLQSLEAEVEKAEEDLGCTEKKTSKVANLFTPLFKSKSEKQSTSEHTGLFKTEDYFQQERT